MDDHPVTVFTAPFAQWAGNVRAESHTSTEELLYHQGGTGHPSCSTPWIKACCRLLEAIDQYGLGKQCRRELLSDGVYRKLGEATAANWEGISERLLQQKGKQAHDPAWLQQGQQDDNCSAVFKRFRQACCSAELAVLMLRLAVRAACLAGSWYGPWESKEALLQLIRADAWPSLLRALRALLAAFGPDLARQYNAINIVSDILHVSQALSTCCSQSGMVCSMLLTARSKKGFPHASADLLQPERAAHAPGLQAL